MDFERALEEGYKADIVVRDGCVSCRFVSGGDDEFSISVGSIDELVLGKGNENGFESMLRNNNSSVIAYMDGRDYVFYFGKRSARARKLYLAYRSFIGLFL
ncbi:MAG: hypothetical protein ACP5D2_04235 [Candidatus Nanoarchaeia archaeon]